jgi:hypothetical protein
MIELRSRWMLERIKPRWMDEIRHRNAIDLDWSWLRACVVHLDRRAQDVADRSLPPLLASDVLARSAEGGAGWPRTRGQRCWVHKTANVLKKLPKSQQSKAKRALQEIWMAETKKDALLAFDAFIETWGVKYDRATERVGVEDLDLQPHPPLALVSEGGRERQIEQRLFILIGDLDTPATPVPSRRVVSHQIAGKPARLFVRG